MVTINDEVLLELTQQNEQLRNEIERLRILLWQHHGCSSEYLYGDDGELQCHNQEHDALGCDFKREPINLLEWQLMNDFSKRIFPRPKEK